MTLTEDQIKKDIELLEKAFTYIITKVGSGTRFAKKLGFQVINPKLLLDDLPPHTRSIAWLFETILLQTAKKLEISQLKTYNKKTHFEDIDSWPSDIDIIDYFISLVSDGKIYVNVKMHNIQKKSGKNDLNQGAKIFSHFTADPDFRFYYCVVNFEFTGEKGTVASLISEKPTILYAPWVKDVYVNPKNGHLQAKYDEEGFEPRKMKLFLKELEEKLNEKDTSKSQLATAIKKIDDDEHLPKSHKLWLKEDYVKELDLINVRRIIKRNSTDIPDHEGKKGIMEKDLANLFYGNSSTGNLTKLQKNITQKLEKKELFSKILVGKSYWINLKDKKYFHLYQQRLHELWTHEEYKDKLKLLEQKVKREK